MDKIQRRTYKDWLWRVTLIIFLICLIEGLMYYWDPENIVYMILENIENAIKAYKIDPDIKLDKAREFMLAHPGQYHIMVITWIYSLSVIVAPFCTVGGLLLVVETPFKYIMGKNRWKKAPKVFIWGQGKDKKEFVKQISNEIIESPTGSKKSSHKYKLYVMEKTSLDKSLKYDYISKGIKVLMDYDDSDVTLEWKEGFFKNCSIAEMDTIILCEEDPLESFLHLKNIEAFLENRAEKKKNLVTVQIICNDLGVSTIIKDYYESTPNKPYLLYINDIKKKAIQKMLNTQEFAIHRYNMLAKEKGIANYLDTHIGIIGFGEFGQRFLIESMNMAVLGADSNITIDVFDKHMKDIIGVFMKRFSPYFIRKDKDCVPSFFEFHEEGQPLYQIHIKADAKSRFDTDGELCINFWNLDTETLSFTETFERCSQTAFTYILIAMDNEKRMVSTLVEIKRILDFQNNVLMPTVIVRTKEDGSAVDMLGYATNDGQTNWVGHWDEKQRIYSMQSLKDDSIMEQAKQFHYTYTKVNGFLEEGQTPEVLWNCLDFYGRDASIAQSMHQQVKQDLAHYLLTQEQKEKEYLERIEHRRWNYYMISQGYAYDNKEKKDKKRKLHSCIRNFQRLKETRPETIPYDDTPYKMIEGIQ